MMPLVIAGVIILCGALLLPVLFYLGMLALGLTLGGLGKALGRAVNWVEGRHD